jgi:ankyrin repeat protein
MLSMGNYGSGARWLLGKAIENNDAALVEWCLAHGANPNAAPARDPRFHQASPYQQAVQLGHEAVAERLARHGATGVAVSPSPMESFVAACLRLDRDRIWQEIDRHPEYLRSPLPLFAAAERDRADVIEFLLDLGMSPNVENEAQERPLHMAAYNNALRAARMLIARGADIDPREHHYLNTPLGGAVWHQYREMIDLLAPLSRDVWELTYLGRVDRLRDLFAEDPARARVTWEGQTPLMWLPPEDERLALEVVELFLSHGADSTMRNEHGATAAERAKALGMFAVAERLSGDRQESR